MIVNERSNIRFFLLAYLLKYAFFWLNSIAKEKYNSLWRLLCHALQHPIEVQFGHKVTFRPFHKGCATERTPCLCTGIFTGASRIQTDLIWLNRTQTPIGNASNEQRRGNCSSQLVTPRQACSNALQLGTTNQAAFGGNNIPRRKNKVTRAKSLCYVTLHRVFVCQA